MQPTIGLVRFTNGHKVALVYIDKAKANAIVRRFERSMSNKRRKITGSIVEERALQPDNLPDTPVDTVLRWRIEAKQYGAVLAL